MILRRIFALAVFVIFAGAAAVRAHPLHLSTTEARYNADTGRLEIATKLFLDDFETELSSRIGKPVDLVHPNADTERAASDYLSTHLRILTADNETSPLTWEGMEVEKEFVWLYATAPHPGANPSIRYEVTLLCDRFIDQLNSLRLKIGDSSNTLLFNRDTGPLTLSGKP